MPSTLNPKLHIPNLLLLFLIAIPGLAGERYRVSITNSRDGSRQPCYVVVPDGFDARGEAVPLLVVLHSWSGNVEQRTDTQLALEQLAEQRGWIYLFPNFRGRNDHPEACGSTTAQQCILDAVEWAKIQYPIDTTRVYLTGVSGGGHMTMLMVGRHPEIWAAASAWVGISDLGAWHNRHAKSRYGEMLRKCCGGAPGDGATVDAEYRARSPITHLQRAVGVPFDIAAGVHDGHEGSVPIRHSLDAFNKIAEVTEGATPVSAMEIEQISRPHGRLENPSPIDLSEDSSFGRPIYLRRTAGKARVTIFEGGHEGIAQAAIEWLEQHQKAETN